MGRMRIAALGAAAALAAAGVPAVSAQTVCRQVQVVTTRTATPVRVTPLDAIAFPVSPAAGSTVLVRQISVCPPGANTPVFVTPVPSVVGAPLFSSPVLETPVFGPVQQEQPNIYIVTPGSAPAASSTAAPTRPPVVAGTVPEQTVADLAAHGGRFDRTVVSVDGTAQAVQQTTDGRGNPITTFRLEAGGASVEVLVWGRVAVRNGETVRASGPFYLTTPFAGASGRPWHGVIEAETVER